MGPEQIVNLIFMITGVLCVAVLVKGFLQAIVSPIFRAIFVLIVSIAFCVFLIAAVLLGMLFIVPDIVMKNYPEIYSRFFAIFPQIAEWDHVKEILEHVGNH